MTLSESMAMRGPAEFMRQISSGALLASLVSLAAIGAAVLSLYLMQSAHRSADAALHRMENLALAELQSGGLSGLSLRLDEAGRALFAGDNPTEVILWRKLGGTWRLHRATNDALAATMVAPPGFGTGQIVLGDQQYDLRRPDIETLSRDWVLPMADVALALAAPAPAPEVTGARRVILAVWAGLALSALIGAALLFNHKRRYRDGIADMTRRLVKFSDGDTSVRVIEQVPAPELADLAHNLNRVLPRIDDLVTGLRFLSANMAHELKTPLQNIRSDLTRLRRSETAQDSDKLANAIDRTIDQANARLQALMQLFRLEAQAAVPKTKIDLSLLCETATEDMLDALQTKGRNVVTQIAPGLRATGNRALLDLMLSNLLVNAHKYAPYGALITVSLTEPSSGKFCLSVANTGASFPSDVRNRAFERFSRSGRDDDLPGSGIGLSLIRAIAARHGFTARIDPSQTEAIVIITGDCA